MVDNINVQKILYPSPSPVKINALKQKNGHMQNRHFERHLEEEENEDKNKKEEDLPQLDRSSSSQQEEGEVESDDEKDLEMTNQTKKDGQLKLVDIVV